MSRESKRAELYAHLFQSLKEGLGIDAETEDPVQAYLDRCQRGDYDPNLIDVVLLFRAKNKDEFLLRYPEELRDYLWEMCERVKKKIDKDGTLF